MPFAAPIKPVGLMLFCLAALPLAASAESIRRDSTQDVESVEMRIAGEAAAEALGIVENMGIPFDAVAVRDAVYRAVFRAVDRFAAFDGPVAGEPDGAAADGAAADELPVNPVLVSQEASNGVAYVRLAGLPRGSWPAVAVEMQRCAGNAGDGIVLDLRGAGGDGWDCIEHMAGMFAAGSGAAAPGAGDASGQSARGRGLIPAVLLVDGKTRGAAELLAALLKGRPGVMVMGSETMGDMNERESVALSGGGVVRLAVRSMKPGPAAPGGPDYSGIRPDVAVSAINDAALMLRARDAAAGMRALDENAR